MTWFQTALKKYAVVSVRVQRAEYGYYALFYVIINLVLCYCDRLMDPAMPQDSVGVLIGVFVLGTLIPLIGAVVLLISTVQDGTPGDNRFGPNPKAQHSA